MGRRKIAIANNSENGNESNKKDNISDATASSDSVVKGRQTRGRTVREKIAPRNNDKETGEPLIQSETKKTISSEEDKKPKLAVKKRGRPKKESDTETNGQDEMESTSSVDVKEEENEPVIDKAETTEKKEKPAKRKLSEKGESLIQPETKKTISSEEDKKPKLVVKKRGRPKKESDMETNSQDEMESTSSVDVKEEENEPVIDKAETKDKKGKPSKRKLSKEDNYKEEEEVPPKVTKKSKVSKGKQKVKDEKTDKKNGIREGMERSVVKKGAAAVDGLCPIANSSHVYCEKNDIWDCMLNQTNIQFNNNKYYIIQLLKDDNKNTYSVWMRWGRVGCPGQNALKPFGSNLEKAKEAFMKKFSDKTKNDWEEKDSFEKVPGKYDLLKMDYSDDAVDNIVKKETNLEKPKKKVESKLHEKLKALIELICDVKAMEDAVIEMKYDAKKAPLGKLTSDQVKAGYLALKKIESVILGSGKPSNKDLLEACNAFYTRIPHYFGMKVPPLIRTRKEIQEKLALLQALGDIQAAMNVINQPLSDDVHPADQHYEGLKCDMNPLKKEDSLYQTLEKYLLTTHGKTHSMYKIKILDIFEAKKCSEEDRFKDIGNRMLLWHGSRLTNWAGILSQGLRIAPPEAPSTGYMFGKGIYFADMASKSANYCMPSYQNKTGLLVLCDVSLGICRELLDADYEANKLPNGYHSVKGLGKTAPDPKNLVTLPDGVVIPMGPGVDTKIQNKSGYTLQYNEYIVYDVSQVKIKYLFKVEFEFK